MFTKKRDSGFNIIAARIYQWAGHKVDHAISNIASNGFPVQSVQIHFGQSEIDWIGDVSQGVN